MPMYQPEIETMSQEQIRKLQSERLVKQVRHVYDNVPYYRAKMEEYLHEETDLAIRGNAAFAQSDRLRKQSGQRKHPQLSGKLLLQRK